MTIAAPNPNPVPRQELQRILLWDPDAKGAIKQYRMLPFHRTSTPGIVITADYARSITLPDHQQLGALWKFPVLTHATTGWKICGPFDCVDHARKIAGALGAIIDWQIDYPEIVTRFRAAIEAHPALVDWWNEIWGRT